MIMRFVSWYWSEIKKGADPKRIASRAQEMMKKKCPRCGKTNINKVEVSGSTKIADAFLLVMTGGIRKGTKALNVCRDDGFSWEDR